jgi:hypothetical protein
VSSPNGSSSEQAITVEGIVEAVNERGVRVQGDWYNVSHFRPVQLPEQGVLVRLEVRPNGFIKSLQVLKANYEEIRNLPAQASRDDRISRLAVLKAAAYFGASRPDMRSADVLKVAASWLAWVDT